MTKTLEGMIMSVAAATLAGLLTFAVTSPASAAATAPTALGVVRPGLWTIVMEGETAARRLCVQDTAMFIQVRHQNSACNRMVLANESRGTTVHYSCPGAGWGRTELRVTSADSLRIDTQGIADNAPFAYRAQAHRDGDCRR